MSCVLNYLGFGHIILNNTILLLKNNMAKSWIVQYTSHFFMSLASAVHKKKSCSLFHSSRLVLSVRFTLLTVYTMIFHEHSFSCAEENRRRDNRRKKTDKVTPFAALPPEDSWSHYKQKQEVNGWRRKKRVNITEDWSVSWWGRPAWILTLYFIIDQDN